MHYRRSKAKGSTFFFTLVTYQRQALFQHMHNINLLRTSIQEVKKYRPFKINAYVILPDHLHVIWTLPEGDNNFSIRWQLIKSKFTKLCSLQYKSQPNAARVRKSEQCVWQRRFWEHQIRNENDFMRHVDYIHYNPVKHQHVSRAGDWSHSSFLHYVKVGAYPSDWGGQSGDGFDLSIGAE